MRPTILTVDDAKAVRLIAQKVLSGFDCGVNEASNGYNALFVMERALPNLILLDVSMPIMGGVELLELLKSKPELKAIPVIMLTSPADHAVIPKITGLGVSSILMKPFTESALLEKIRDVLALNAK
jgi:CheY-like chemotaxis protein